MSRNVRINGTTLHGWRWLVACIAGELAIIVCKFYRRLTGHYPKGITITETTIEKDRGEQAP